MSNRGNITNNAANSNINRNYRTRGASVSDAEEEILLLRAKLPKVASSGAIDPTATTIQSALLSADAAANNNNSMASARSISPGLLAGKEVSGGLTTTATTLAPTSSSLSATAAPATAAGPSSSSHPAVLDVSGGLPDPCDVVFAPEKVNAHTLMNKWIVQDETRNFAFLRKEKKAVVTFQCRIIVKGAKHIQLQVSAGPSVEFLLPTWILIRYVQSELLPPCILEDYHLVEAWVKAFIVEVKALMARTVNAMGVNEQNHQLKGANNGSNQQQQQQPEMNSRMTRHLVHAAAAVVNASDLFLGLISAAQENAGTGLNGLVLMSGGGGGPGRSLPNLYMHNDDEEDEESHHPGGSTTSPALVAAAAAARNGGTPPANTPLTVSPQTASSASGGLFSRFLNRNNQQQQQGGDKNNQQNQQQKEQQITDLSPSQQVLAERVMLRGLIPKECRSLPHPLTFMSAVKFFFNGIYAFATQTKVEDVRARFFLPRPQTKDEWSVQEALRGQVKKNRTHAAMFIAFLFLMLCRMVSFDLFLIISGFVLYGVRYLFTEYKNIFIYFTKRTAQSRVNRVKDWFSFSLRRSGNNNSSSNNSNNKALLADGSAADAMAAAAVAAAVVPDQSPNFDLEEWDFWD